MIREISIENFKSIESLKLNLGRFNVLIGANGSGKSNILEAITFGASAPMVTLTNEFLTTRGIRMTEPELMFSGFDLKASNKIISIKFSNEKKETSECRIVSDKDKWSIMHWSDKQQKILLNKLQGHIKSDNTLTVEKILNKFTSDDYSEMIIDATKYIEVNKISNFLIFAPENYFLRNPYENQIKPLGIRGEGLMKHLAEIGLKNPAIFDEVKESLSLIEWFDDIEFDRAADGYFTGRIRIKDVYLKDGVKCFDTNSANEGFLYLLFYLTLFISDETPKFFAIDNIDAALNPKLAADLMGVLSKLAEKHDKQVIFTTHNPAILDGLNLNDDEQRLFVISRNAEGRTKAKRIENKPIPTNGHSIKLSEHFLRGNLGGLNF